MKNAKLGHRGFLRTAAAAAATGAVAWGIYRLLAPNRPDDPDTYYLERQETILRDFDKLAIYIHPVLSAHYDMRFADTIVSATRSELAALIPQIPYIGGAANGLSANLTESAGALALYRAMLPHGISTAQIGEILYQSYIKKLENTPYWLRAVYWGIQTLSPRNSHVRKEAATSQLRQYPDDWVFTYVEGDGNTFDWGVDYTECGICKFFHAQDADEFTPYLCQLDFPMSRIFNMGLERAQTLTQGAKHCDFRYKHGRETQSKE